MQKQNPPKYIQGIATIIDMSSSNMGMKTQNME